MATAKQISERVRDWIVSELERTGKSRKDLATALKLAPSGVTRILQGERDVSTEELVRLSHFFGSPDAYLHMLMEFYPDFKLERRPDFDSTKPLDVEDHVASVKRAVSSTLKQVSELPGVWVVATSPAEEPYDLFIEDKIITRIPIPIGLKRELAVLCILMNGDSLAPKVTNGDPIFLIPPGDYDEENPLIVFEWPNLPGDTRRPINIGLLVGGNPETGVLELEHPKSGKRRQIDPSGGVKGLYRAASLKELFDL